MRLSLFSVLLFVAAAGASDWRTPVDLPHGGAKIVLPGFTFRSPGYGWQVINDLPEEGNVIFANRRTQFVYSGPGPYGKPDPSHTTVMIWLGSGDAPDANATAPDDFEMAASAVIEAQRDAYHRAGFTAHGGMSAVVDGDGRHCLRGGLWTDPATGSESISFTLFTCMHTGKPDFSISVRSEVRWKKGTQPLQIGDEVNTVFRTLEATPVPYRSARVALPGSAAHMVAAGGAIWTTYVAESSRGVMRSGAVLRIDPRSNSIVATIPLKGFVSELAAAPDGIWVAAGKQLVRIDPASNKITATLPLAQNITSLIAGGGYLWALSHDVPANGERATRVLRIDPKTGKTDEIKQPGGAPREIVFANGALHIAVEGALMRIDPASLAVTGSRPLEKGVLHYDGRYLWNLVATDSFVPARLNPEEYRLIPKRFIVRLDRTDLEAPDAPPETVARYRGPAMIPPSAYAWWNGKFCMLVNDAVICIDLNAPLGPADVIPCEGAWFGDMAVANGALWVARGTAGHITRFDAE